MNQKEGQGRPEEGHAGRAAREQGMHISATRIPREVTMLEQAPRQEQGHWNDLRRFPSMDYSSFDRFPWTRWAFSNAGSALAMSKDAKVRHAILHATDAGDRDDRCTFRSCSGPLAKGLEPALLKDGAQLACALILSVAYEQGGLA